jgi:hypothetical protein
VPVVTGGPRSIRLLVAAIVIVAAFAAPFAVLALTGDDGPTPATARTASGFPLERVAEDFEPPARTAVVRDFRAAAPLPELRRQRARRAPAPRRTAPRGGGSAATRAPSSPSSGGATRAPTSTPPAAPAPAPPPPPPATTPARSAPAPAPAAPSRPAPDDFDSGESFDSTG